MQQINLLSGLPKRARYDVTALVMAQVVGFFVVIMLLASAYQEIRLYTLGKRLINLQSTLKDSNNNLRIIMDRYPEIAKEKQIQEQMEAIEQQLTSKKAILASLTRGNIGFSPYLTALSKAIVPGVWLTEINIVKSTEAIQLTGKASTPTLVMTFLQNLNQQPGFIEKEFKTFQFSDPKDKAGQINFVLSTSAEAATASLAPQTTAAK